MAILETRLASLEARQAIFEGHIGKAAKSKPGRELSPGEKKVVRARLVDGQGKARAQRESEVARQDGREATDGSPKTTK